MAKPVQRSGILKLPVAKDGFSAANRGEAEVSLEGERSRKGEDENVGLSLLTASI